VSIIRIRLREVIKKKKKNLITFRRRIRIILAELLSEEHGNIGLSPSLKEEEKP
jgi:hypothetical protein